MIRITYGDTELILGEKDDQGRALKFAPKDVPVWVTVIDQVGFKLEYLQTGPGKGGRDTSGQVITK